MLVLHSLTVQSVDAPDAFARWLGVGSLAVAVLGLLLSLLGFRRDRVRVRVWAGGRTRWWRIYWIHASPVMWLPVRVVNKGRMPVDVTSAWWEVRSKDRPRLRSVDVTPESRGFDEAESESPFPLSLPGLSTRDWQTRTRSWSPEDHGRETYRVRYCVRLGNDAQARSPWILTIAPVSGDTDARALDRAAFPRLWRPLREILRTKAATERHRERYRRQRQESKERSWD